MSGKSYNGHQPGRIGKRKEFPGTNLISLYQDLMIQRQRL
jgi:hypothetical protein